MCVLFSIIEYVYISVQGVALLDMSIHGSSYVSSSGPFILRIHFVVCFESEMSGLLLGALGHCPSHHCVRYWRDLLSYLIWADHHLFSYSMLHHHSRFHFYLIIFIPPLIPSLQWPHFRVRNPLRTIIMHLIISSVFLHYIVIFTTFTVGIFWSMAHDIFYTCCILYMRAWVLIIGYLGLVSFHFYHLITLAYVTSRVLRPPWRHDITHYVW